eukprot:TRINITY_DN11793_c0_g1_i1.p1 TRINITY_DN11793_c0_g1~~TRINITY_DN11793_c0_g1_i1.p1  ORF type:complete len:189 (-),score=33.07 TRINITY_DN11793_c0_g1_i1:37-603(-)
MSNESMEEYTICILGDGGVGKSSLVLQYVANEFSEEYEPTIEDSFKKQVTIDNTNCVVFIIDTAGQDEYTSLRDQYIKQGEGFLIIYSVIHKGTFENVVKFIQEVHRAKNDLNIPMLIVGNKVDLDENREVSNEEGKMLASQYNFHFYESSAKKRINVDNVFEQCVREIIAYRMKFPKQTNSNCCLIL